MSLLVITLAFGFAETGLDNLVTKTRLLKEQRGIPQRNIFPTLLSCLQFEIRNRARTQDKPHVPSVGFRKRK